MFGSARSKYSILNDTSLLERHKKTGNLDFLGVLYHRYMHLVYGVALKYLKDREQSKDAVMQIFEILVDKVPDQDIRNFKSWLYVVTKNHCLGIIRNKPALERIDNLFMESDELIHHNGERQDQHKELMSRAMENLSEHQHICIKMFYYQSMSYQQIAQETGYGLKKVKSYIQNGKRNLKIYLEEHGRG
jgi:RNA polymerase sigma-70 factor (ECF subfamily)